MRFAEPLRRKIPSTSVAAPKSSDQDLCYSEGRQLAIFLQKHPTFGHHDRNVTIDETFTLVIGKRYRDVCISDTFGQGNGEDSRNCNGCSMISMDDLKKGVIPIHGAQYGERERVHHFTQA